MAETQIEWTDAIWNPVAGCKIQSAGCTESGGLKPEKETIKVTEGV